MDIILLGITVVSLAVALVMSVMAWRVTRDEKQRSAARVAALSLAASDDDVRPNVKSIGFESRAEKPGAKAPWTPASFDSAADAPATASLRVRPAIVPAAAELPLNQPQRVEPVRVSEPAISHASGFLGAEEVHHDTGNRQKSLAFAAVILFAVLSGGLVWMMSSPEGTSAAAVGPNSPLELVSLSHQREKDKLAVSGLVRNPVAGQPVQNLSAVVFLFDRTGTFVTSSRAKVDFLKLGPGDETPFVVSLDAPGTVSRYRVSFRTDDGVVPHVDRRVSSQESVVKSEVVNRQ
jgi:hypothetical protein